MIITLIFLAAIIAVIFAGYFMLEVDGECDAEPPSWIGENWTDDELNQTSLGQDIRGKTSLDQDE